MHIPIENIYYLLSYAWNRLEEAETIDVNPSDYNDSINLFARVIVAGSNHLLKRGLDKSYIAIQEDIPGIKGRIMFKDSLNKQLFDQGKANCSFDEFSSNVIHNQILKSTLRKLTRFAELDSDLRTKVWDCYYRFIGVDEIDIQLHHFQKVRIHRNNYGYDFLLKVARLIFENAVLDESSGSYKFVDFTRDERAMAGLFEDFVRSFYSREQSMYKVRREDIKWKADALYGSDLSLLPKMQTDITLESVDHKLIIDTKFYRSTLSSNFNSEKIHSNNLYQIYSYLSNVAKDSKNPNNESCDGMLLYPTTQQGTVEETYQMGSHRIRVATVDLSQDWRTIHERLLELIQFQQASLGI